MATDLPTGGDCTLQPVYSSDDGETWSPLCTITIADGQRYSQLVETFTVEALTQSLLDAALAQAAAYPGDSGLYDMLGPYLDVTP